jgi:hypothetical protein
MHLPEHAKEVHEGGAMAAMTMVEYGSARNSIIRKAAAPMMGV